MGYTGGCCVGTTAPCIVKESVLFYLFKAFGFIYMDAGTHSFVVNEVEVIADKQSSGGQGQVIW